MLTETPQDQGGSKKERNPDFSESQVNAALRRIDGIVDQSSQDNKKKPEALVDGAPEEISQVKRIKETAPLTGPQARVLSEIGQRSRGMMYEMTKDTLRIIGQMHNLEEGQENNLIPIAPGKTPSGAPYQLRATPAAAFKLAEQYAHQLGYELGIESTYRSKDHQEELLGTARTEEKGKMVASSDGSPHRTGGAVDVYLKKNGRRVTPLRGERANQYEAVHTQNLEKIMNAAGFVVYANERWHFEIGTADWWSIMCQLGVFESVDQQKVYKAMEVTY